ncbi:unnamed protein product [Didymodactylos carnosus]|nr:unnamed protein product [Didymodactylos carnosus]CAF4213338.1 unnamed protein product [Didymodactylos carnosus]
MTSPCDQAAQGRMIDYCRSLYKDDPSVQRTLDEFSDYYDGINAVFWYSRDTFLYRDVQKALRQGNIESILRFSFLICDLYSALAELYNSGQPQHSKVYRGHSMSSKELQTLQSHIGCLVSTNAVFFTSSDRKIAEVYSGEGRTVYRGQLISRKELTNLKRNVGGYISISTFFSTTLDKEVALIFSGFGFQRPQYESVIFEIEFDAHHYQQISTFADISKLSHIADEKEILFSVGTIFKYMSCTKFPDNLIDAIEKFDYQVDAGKILTLQSNVVGKHFQEEAKRHLNTGLNQLIEKTEDCAIMLGA